MQRGHLGVLYTTLKCWEGLEFSILQEFQKIPALETHDGMRGDKKQSFHLSSPILCSLPLQQLGPPMGEFCQKVSWGEMK